MTRILSLFVAGAFCAAAESNIHQPAFEHLKTLAGEWEAKTEQGKARLSYELTAGGTALVERETADHRPAMMTIYHMDGSRLLLTHYCMVGNQPRMVAHSFNSESKELEFRFLDATGLKSPESGHMRNARFRFLDKNRFVSEWEYYENGKSKFKVTGEYTRIR